MEGFDFLLLEAVTLFVLFLLGVWGIALFGANGVLEISSHLFTSRLTLVVGVGVGWFGFLWPVGFGGLGVEGMGFKGVVGSSEFWVVGFVVWGFCIGLLGGVFVVVVGLVVVSVDWVFGVVIGEFVL